MRESEVLKTPNDCYEYRYLSGPVDSVSDIEDGVEFGNCRYAIQLYFYRIHRIWLEREEILLPEGYHKTGKFIFREEPVDFSMLKTGDIIYAQNLADKNVTL